MLKNQYYCRVVDAEDGRVGCQLNHEYKPKNLKSAPNSLKKRLRGVSRTLR